MEKTTQAMYLNTNWLDDTTVPVAQTAELTTTAGNTAALSYINSWITPNYYWGYSYPSKIRLTLSEIEEMRAVAKKNKELKQIFQKLAPHIEIVVDF